MIRTLPEVLQTLRSHEVELRNRGVLHAAVFGSVARGEPTASSDVDVLIDLDPAHPIGLFEYAHLKLDLADLLGGSVDVVHRQTLKPLLRERILREAVRAF
jgi:predicted nucleotidyltransferase